MAPGHDEDVEAQFFPHELRMDMPDHHAVIFPHDPVQFGIGVAEGTSTVFEALPHAVVLFVRPAAFKTELFFIGETARRVFLGSFVHRSFLQK